MSFVLPHLPYERHALEPIISAETLNFHHGKHHQKYVSTLNELIENTEFASQSLDEIVLRNEGKLFNQAAQVWNHTFYWHCMKPGGGGRPDGKLAEAIDRDFGSYEQFRQEFGEAAATQFGSGWAWLVINGNHELGIMQTANADLPQRHNRTPLLTIDVWEHAYYIDYRNARPTYIEAFLDKLINWEHVAEAYRKA